MIECTNRKQDGEKLNYQRQHLLCDSFSVTVGPKTAQGTYRCPCMGTMSKDDQLSGATRQYVT